MNVTIRPAVENDVAEILQIVNHAIAHTTAIYDYDPRTLDMQMLWFNEKKGAGFPIIVAEYEGKAIGFGAYGTFRQRAAYQYTVEHSVYVSDEFIGQGIGRILLEELISLAKAQKLHLMIGAIDASNAGSIAFHKKLGFSETAVIREVAFKFGEWLDLMLMELRLE
jgi:L-amino acid N-acyltransferase YncA